MRTASCKQPALNTDGTECSVNFSQHNKHICRVGSRVPFLLHYSAQLSRRILPSLILPVSRPSPPSQIPLNVNNDRHGSQLLGPMDREVPSGLSQPPLPWSSFMIPASFLFHFPHGLPPPTPSLPRPSSRMPQVLRTMLSQGAACKQRLLRR